MKIFKFHFFGVSSVLWDNKVTGHQLAYIGGNFVLEKGQHRIDSPFNL